MSGTLQLSSSWESDHPLPNEQIMMLMHIDQDVTACPITSSFVVVSITFLLVLINVQV